MKDINPYAAPASSTSHAESVPAYDVGVTRRQTAISIIYAAILLGALVYASVRPDSREIIVTYANAVAATAVEPSVATPDTSAPAPGSTTAAGPAATLPTASAASASLVRKEPEGNVVDMTY